MQKKPPVTNILIIVFVGLLSVLGGILRNLASNELTPGIEPYVRFVWPLIGLVTLALIVLAIFQHKLQQADEYPSKVLDRQSREKLLARVCASWITGSLEPSLHGAMLLVLGLVEQPDAIENPWKPVFQQPTSRSFQYPRYSHCSGL